MANEPDNPQDEAGEVPGDQPAGQDREAALRSREFAGRLATSQTH